MKKSAWILPSLTGLCLFLSFPKANLFFFAFIALVPLFFALKGISFWEGFKAGIIAGFVYNAGVLYWIAYVVVKYGYLPLYAGIAAMIAVAAILSVYVGIFASLQARFMSRGFPAILTAPFLWVGMEYARAHLFSGFPWEILAYSQHRNLPLLQIADVAGMYGVSFFIVLVNAVVYDALNRGSRSKVAVFSEVLIAVFLAVSLFSYGYYRMDRVSRSVEKGRNLEVMIVQGNIDQSIKWDPAYQRETMDIYGNLSTADSSFKYGLIVWPETATPFYFQDVNDYHREVVNIARRSESYLLLGSPSYRLEAGREHILNSAFLLSPEGRVAGRYDKVHLVPFGEYVPLRPLFPFMARIAGVGDFLPGKGFDTLEVNGEKIGTLICYEAIFPEIAAEYRRQGARLFVNITNDAWFGETAAPYQHLSMAALRAVENRTYIVRAANTGISAVISPTGEVVAKTGLFEKKTLRGSVHLMEGQTFYSRFGDIFAYGCFAVAAAFLAITFRREKND